MTEVERIVSRAKRGRLLFIAVIIILCVLLIGGVIYSIVVNVQQDTKITQVQHSACEVDAAGRECQQTRRESSRAANLATTCIVFWKAGYPCPKPGSEAARKGVVADSGNSPSGQPSPGKQPGGSEEEKPPKGGGGGHAAPRHPGSHRPPAPQHPGGEVAPAPAPPSSPAPAPTFPPAKANPAPPPAAEHSEGTKACVDVVVSACAEVPKLLP